MTTKTGFHGFILVFVAALVSWPLAAQEVTGNITGAVVDPSGAAVANATVTVTATSQGIVLRTLQTNEAGLYSATLLPVGTYSVTVEAAGFKRSTRDSIELNANAKYTADFPHPVRWTTSTRRAVLLPIPIRFHPGGCSPLPRGSSQARPAQPPSGETPRRRGPSPAQRH